MKSGEIGDIVSSVVDELKTGKIDIGSLLGYLSQNMNSIRRAETKSKKDRKESKD